MNDILQIIYRFGDAALIKHAIDCVVEILKKYCKNEQDASIILRKLFREEQNGSKVI
jgi:hypothetical protein